jgi:antitoxin component YwqK of YwqJK toxin-antitoxin module
VPSSWFTGVHGVPEKQLQYTIFFIRMVRLKPPMSLLTSSTRPCRTVVVFAGLLLLPPALQAQKTVETTYASGAIRERYVVVSLESGATVKDGAYSAFFENGNRKTEIPYRKGKKDGTAHSWYENGRLRCMITYKDGRLCGPAKWYHPEGGLAIVGYYGDNGEREYLWELFHRTGEACARINYSGGVIEKKEYFAPDSVIDALFRKMEHRTTGKEKNISSSSRRHPSP